VYPSCIWHLCLSFTEILGNRKLVLARYGPKGKRYDTISTKYRDMRRHDTTHKCNVKCNELQHWGEFVKECLLLLQWLQAWSVQQDDDRSETADTGTCADDLKRDWLVGNVDRRQRDIGTSDDGDATVLDR